MLLFQISFAHFKYEFHKQVESKVALFFHFCTVHEFMHHKFAFRANP